MSQPKIKRRVGKYEVGRTIGEGTFAKVKFARNSETGEPVALKILDKEKVLKHKMAEQVWLVNSFYDKLFVSHCFTCLKRNWSYMHYLCLFFNCFLVHFWKILALFSLLDPIDFFYFIYMLPPEKVFQYCPRILKLPLFWQIKREIETMKLIKHPNVVRLYEVPLLVFSIYYKLYAVCLSLKLVFPCILLYQMGATSDFLVLFLHVFGQDYEQ